MRKGEKMKILVGLSGGVDSSAAAAILKRDFEVCGVTLSLYCGDAVCRANTEKNIRDAAAVCSAMGLEHRVLHMEDEFKKYVIDGFIDDYIKGLTPNPCVRCNKNIKFGLMLDYALKNGFDKIATGHYATVEKSGGKYYLKKAKDVSKDQTYVLYNFTQEILSRVEFPLGIYTKPECREIAEENGFVTAHKSDSQDICFIPSGDYGAFIEGVIGKYPSGDYLDVNGNVIGRHSGVIHYTVGQRKGLGIALGGRAFVISKNAENNTVVLGTNEMLSKKRINIKDVNFITEPLCDGDTVYAKIRYSQHQAKARFYSAENGAVLEFEEAQRAPTAGQSAVFYKDDYCLGGGIIIKE